MPPNYESQTFWDARFKKENHFEWLGDGQETIIPVLRPYLQKHTEADPDGVRPPLLLHIGVGTSTLSDDILKEYHAVYRKTFDNPVILNTDFAHEAVRRGVEATEGQVEMSWEQLDLLTWKEMRALREKTLAKESRGFSFVVDKSTSDAISCRADILFEEETFGGSPEDFHPLIVSAAKNSPKGYISMHAAAMLALHLAAVVEAGGIWIVLSYSSNRFPFLTGNKSEDEDRVDIGQYWKLERVEAVKIPEDKGRAGGVVHAPDVFHYLYILRRTDAVVAMQ